MVQWEVEKASVEYDLQNAVHVEELLFSMLLLMRCLNVSNSLPFVSPFLKLRGTVTWTGHH